MSVMWMWGILGLVLLGAEMMTGTLMILWFGIAALLLSALVWLMPNLDIALQLFLYAILSLGSLFVWRHFYESTEDDSRIGQAQGDEIGRVGTIIKAVSAQQNGTIEFAQGVMGSRQWVATSSQTLEVGQQAEIIAVEGNTLSVTLKV